MKFFRMEKWGKRSFSLAFILSIFSIIIVAYVVKISKESWNYRIDETQCHKREGIIEKVQDGKEISNGKILKFINITFKHTGCRNEIFSMCDSLFTLLIRKEERFFGNGSGG